MKRIEHINIDAWLDRIWQSINYVLDRWGYVILGVVTAYFAAHIIYAVIRIKYRGT
jgi:hypothetical protein